MTKHFGTVMKLGFVCDLWINSFNPTTSISSKHLINEIWESSSPPLLLPSTVGVWARPDIGWGLPVPVKLTFRHFLLLNISVYFSTCPAGRGRRRWPEQRRQSREVPSLVRAACTLSRQAGCTLRVWGCSRCNWKSGWCRKRVWGCNLGCRWCR